MKRLQVILTQEAWEMVDALCKEANQGFEGGTINYSDAINELIITGKVDIKALQLKHTDLRRALKAMASKDELDLESVLKALTDLRGKVSKKRTTPVDEEF